MDTIIFRFINNKNNHKRINVQKSVCIAYSRQITDIRALPVTRHLSGENW